MQKQEIEIAGYKITQLSETEYEAENSKLNLDFYFEINEENEVDVFVFDSEIKGIDCDIIANFSSDNMNMAVIDAMNWMPV